MIRVSRVGRVERMGRVRRVRQVLLCLCVITGIDPEAGESFTLAQHSPFEVVKQDTERNAKEPL